MRLLLDTHLAIWVVLNDERLTRKVREMIAGADGKVWVSTVSVWEIAIKHALGRPSDPMPFSAERSIELFHASGLQLLDIRPEHAAAVEHLPLLHGNPFDRLLLAQARTEPMHLLSHDAAVIAYGAGVIAV